MENREVVIGVSGGIAAYKTAMVVSQLAQADVAVTVVMSESATQFVSPNTFAALSGRPVVRNLFDDLRYPLGAHIELARQSSLLCVAPASANFIGKAANGIADDLLTTLYLSCTGPVLVAPAMNDEMWKNRSVARNVATLEDDGVHVIPPQEGWLACRTRGMGRMAEPDTIVAQIMERLEQLDHP